MPETKPSVSQLTLYLTSSLKITSSYAITASYALNASGGGGGTSGTSGAGGSSGTSGTGSPGTSGTSGSSGESGTSGTSGSSGTSGNSGSSGSSGSSGVNGDNGTSGTSATAGSSGTSGVGSPGTSGSSGSSATAGSSGTSGVGSPGTSGSSGDSGTSGSSGTSVSVSGTTNRLVKFTSASTIGNTSTVHESGSAFLGVGVSSSLVSRLQVFRSGSNSSVLKVDGGSGTLFEVTDNLSGSLFSVNTIAGFPILEVFSNNRIVAGAYGTNALVVSASSVGIGIATPSTKLHIQGNVSGSQFTSSRRNAVGFSGTASYARRALTASFALNASSVGIMRTGSRYPITASRAITASYALASAGGGGGSGTISSGIVNRIPKYTGTTTVGQSFTPIFESGSAFVGVGPISTSLVSRLQVFRSGSNSSVLKVDGGSGTLFEVTDNLSGSLFSVNTIAGFPILEVFSNNRIVAGAYGTNALVVSASSVGLGITNPIQKFHIYNGNAYIQGIQGVNAAVNYSSFNRLIFNNDFSDIARGPNKITIYDDGAFIAGLSVHNNAVGYYSGNSHIWYKSTSPTVFTEVMRLSGSGNLGIGTTNPVQKLHISSSSSGTSIKSEGGIQMTGSITVRGGLGFGNTSNYTLAKRLIFNNEYNDTARGPNKITIYDDGAFIAGLSVHNSAVGYYSGNNHIWYKSTSPTVFTEFMRLSGSGNLGIGTTNPTVKLHVQGNISGSQFTSSRRNAVGFSGTASYARRALTASYALASAGGGGSGTVSSGVVNRLAKYTGATTVGSSAIVYESGSAFIGIGVTSSLVSSLQVYRSGSNASVLKVDGGSGTLFEVTDNLSGSLFNVNDITGLPIFEVFSNNRIVAGKYAANDLVVSGSRVGMGTATPQAKLHVVGNISGSQFTSSRRNAIGFSGTASYARRALTASYALNASGGGGGSTLRTGSTYPITASKTSAIAAGVTNRFVKYTNASAVNSSTMLYESGSAFIGIGITSSLVSSLQVYRSGSNASVLKVDGGSGTLFEVTDNLSGSLFNVNDITGLPIFEVFSNNRIVAGKYAANDLVVSGSRVGIGVAIPRAKLHVQGNVSGSQFTSSRTNAVGFFGTASYARRTLTASYALTTAPRTVIYRYGTTSVVNPGSYTNTIIKYDTAVTDSTGWYDNTNGRFTPTVAGWYQVSAGARVYGGSSTIEGYLGLFKNGIPNQIAAVGGQGFVNGLISLLVYFNGSTDYIQLYSNTNSAITNAQSLTTTPFTMVYMTS